MNPKKKRLPVHTEKAPTPAGPFSQAIDANGTVYVAGQVGIDLTTGQTPADVGEETQLVLQYIAAILDQAGLSMQDVVRTTIYITDFADYSKINEAYELYFSSPFPARATLQVSKLVAGARVEIDAVAVR